MKQMLMIVCFLVVVVFLVKSIKKKENENEQLRRTITDLSDNERQLSLKIKKVMNEKDSLQSEYNEALAALDTHRKNLKTLLSSNLSAIPWLAGMMADYLTYDLEVKAKCLEWGYDVKRLKKVESIREIRAEAKKKIEAERAALYNLEYLKQLYPALDDVLEIDYSELDYNADIPDYDPVRGYLKREEWMSLSETERNQLALDRYILSRKKNSWQIGRDYEMAVGYEYRKKGYEVDSFGTYMKLEDLGRDIIAQKNGVILLIQCKYWSHQKMIHEKHIFQLFGSYISYCIEHDVPESAVKPVFVTNISLSEMAKKVSTILGVTIVEHHEMVDFPRIKCNINRDEYGAVTKIYHLPMDTQYDVTQIKNKGEFYAFTVQEAEDHGFRRAFKWTGRKD